MASDFALRPPRRGITSIRGENLKVSLALLLSGGKYAPIILIPYDLAGSHDDQTDFEAQSQNLALDSSRFLRTTQRTDVRAPLNASALVEPPGGGLEFFLI
jgi:hypothetical protein